MNDNCDRSINVSDQDSDQKSILNYYRKLISLYKDGIYGETIRNGELILEFEDVRNVISFKRSFDKEILILVNFQNIPITIFFSFKIKKLILNNYNHLSQDGYQLTLEKYQSIVLEV